MSSHTRNYDRKPVNSAMKIEDAQWNAKVMKREFLYAKSQYRKVIKRNTIIDLEFLELLKWPTKRK